ncbi:hypothetical protein V499_00313 [Pseudogymnoascus sp. VKM F-103]|nr:hypothetical protein V499_00313 [Pseudogymnoascus sp. VKM F-103]
MADGYARITGRPQAVIVHVDVATQALGQGIHNASVGRVPIFIFAGLRPYTESGELPGSRTEYMHWLQESHDQKAIVRQYCSSREVLAEEIEQYSLHQEQWVPIGPAALLSDTVRDISAALVEGYSDPLNQQIPVSFPPTHGRWKVDSYTAVAQLVDYIKSDASITTALKDPKYEARSVVRVAVQKARVEKIASQPPVTSAQALYDQLQPDRLGSWINCGGTGIGWSNGAVLGVKMALADLEGNETQKPSLVCQAVVLTIVLNNGGWKAPQNSTQLVYLQGLNTNASDEEINTSFHPTPNYAALAEAAAGSNVGWENTLDKSGTWIKGLRVGTVGEFRQAVQLANLRVAEEGKGMLIEVEMVKEF